jgi:hypothetical protein
MGVRVDPITEADVAPVAAFLHEHLNGRLSADEWARSIAPSWPIDAPNHGFLLRDDGRVVGSYLGFYSQREIDGRPERFCNLGAWCVLPGYRQHGVRLLRAMLGQEGYTFTDLSPSGSVVPLNVRLRFRFLDNQTALLPNLPWPGRGHVVSDPAGVAELLRGDDLRLYLDHAGAPAAHHVVLVRGDEFCYVVFRRDRFKRLPVFASVLHVSNPDLFRRMVRSFARHLLVRHGLLGMLAELRVVGDRPRPSVLLRKPPRPRMFRSSRLRPDQIDYLYSELVCVAW